MQCQREEKCENFVTYGTAIGQRTDIKDIAQVAVNGDFHVVVELSELVRVKYK